MRVSIKSLLAGALAFGGMSLGANAAVLGLSSTVPQSGFAGITTGAPGSPLATYDFSGQIVGTMTSIDSLTITLSISDGDSGAGEFDNNNLFLTLDGINTGLALDGFTNNNIVTLSLNQLAPGVSAALIAALADNQLVARIIDTDPADGTDPNNFIALPGLIDTTLDLAATTSNGGGPGQVPLPAAVLIAPLGAGLAGMYSRRFRKAK